MSDFDALYILLQQINFSWRSNVHSHYSCSFIFNKSSTHKRKVAESYSDLMIFWNLTEEI